MPASSVLRRLVPVAAPALVAAVGAPAAAAAPSTVRVSVPMVAAETNDSSFTPAVSADGRWVAFASDASNLVPGDFNHKRDIFLRDTRSAKTIRVSVSSTGRQANSASFNPTISDDGRYVVYDSFASNLVPDDLNRQGDVFLYDRVKRTTTRIGRSHDGGELNGQSGFGVISGDGTTIAFESTAGNLLEGGAGSTTQIWAYDRAKDTFDLVTKTFLNERAGGGSGNASLSRDGRFVAFSSQASNLVPHDVNLTEDVFVRDRRTGVTRRASVNSLGGESNAQSTEPSISADGRYVAFESRATTLLGVDPTGQDAPKSLVNPDGIFDLSDTNFVPDVFVHDLATARTERVSVAGDGAQATADSYGASISGDGRYVAFVSLANNLTPGDTNNVREVFLHDRRERTTSRVGVGAQGQQGRKTSVQPVISKDGSVVVFVSDAGNLVPGDRNHEGDVFARAIS
ncbi:MAG: hypothetical protein ACT4QF_13630 [Sporichthyaceae bacterium]